MIEAKYAMMQAFAINTKIEKNVSLMGNNKMEIEKIIKTKVLLIEDTFIIQTVHIRMLENLGCEIDLAKNGQEALNLYQNNKYDLIFLDLGLPDMKGVDVCKLMRIQRNEIPIVILTAQGNSFKESCMQAGANCFLQKPVSKDTLRTVLKCWAK